MCVRITNGRGRNRGLDGCRRVQRRGQLEASIAATVAEVPNSEQSGSQPSGQVVLKVRSTDGQQASDHNVDSPRDGGLGRGSQGSTSAASTRGKHHREGQ